MRDKLVMAYVDDLRKRLHEPNEYGAASVIIGAGFSKNALAIDKKNLL